MGSDYQEIFTLPAEVLLNVDAVFGSYPVLFVYDGRRVYADD